MGTKNNPGEFDCYANAEDDEPMFVLLARDMLTPNLVRQWAHEYEIAKGPDITEEQIAKLNEAYACADSMDDWRAIHILGEDNNAEK